MPHGNIPLQTWPHPKNAIELLGQNRSPLGVHCGLQVRYECLEILVDRYLFCSVQTAWGLLPTRVRPPVTLRQTRLRGPLPQSQYCDLPRVDGGRIRGYSAAPLRTGPHGRGVPLAHVPPSRFGRSRVPRCTPSASFSWAHPMVLQRRVREERYRGLVLPTTWIQRRIL